MVRTVMMITMMVALKVMEDHDDNYDDDENARTNPSC